jgi:peptidoglycan/xylan/chitin deacetylase (PgdA/CDA1 family)
VHGWGILTLRDPAPQGTLRGMLKQAIKRTALKGIKTTLGSTPAVASGVLRAFHVDYGPIRDEVRYRQGKRSAFCFSVDFDVTRPERGDPNKIGTLELLRLSEKYRIPLTWAICGETAENDLRSYHSITDSEISQEIGIHTYSHIDSQAASPDAFRADLQRCLQILNLETRPKTFIFPWNREAHFDVLNEFGFRAFRGARRAVGVPVQRGGLWNIRPVYYVDQKSARAAGLMKDYVNLCRDYSAVCHFWTHPWSIMDGSRSEEMLEALDEVLGHVSTLRQANELETSTLGDLAEWLDSSKGFGPGETEPHPGMSEQPSELSQLTGVSRPG